MCPNDGYGELSIFSEEAFETFFKSNFLPATNWCRYQFNFELEEAKDQVHKAFIRLWENRNELNQHPKAFFYQVLRNLCLDTIKHKRVIKNHQDLISHQIQTDSSDFAGSELKQLGEAVEQAIQKLPDQMQRIFRMSRFENMKYSTIAAALNISVKTVETQMSRALAKLRKELALYLSSLIIFFSGL